MIDAAITAAEKFLGNLHQQYPALAQLNDTALSELTNTKPVEQVPLFAELFSSSRFSFAAVDIGESFSPLGPNSGGGRSLA